MIQTRATLEPHPTAEGYRCHRCATTNVDPTVETWVVLAKGEEPSATLRELHAREVRELAAARIAQGTHRLTAPLPT